VARGAFRASSPDDFGGVPRHLRPLHLHRPVRRLAAQRSGRLFSYAAPGDGDDSGRHPAAFRNGLRGPRRRARLSCIDDAQRRFSGRGGRPAVHRGRPALEPSRGLAPDPLLSRHHARRHRRGVPDSPGQAVAAAAGENRKKRPWIPQLPAARICREAAGGRTFRRRDCLPLRIRLPGLFHPAVPGALRLHSRWIPPEPVAFRRKLRPVRQVRFFSFFSGFAIDKTFWLCHNINNGNQNVFLFRELTVLTYNNGYVKQLCSAHDDCRKMSLPKVLTIILISFDKSAHISSSWIDLLRHGFQCFHLI